MRLALLNFSVLAIAGLILALAGAAVMDSVGFHAPVAPPWWVDSLLKFLEILIKALQVVMWPTVVIVLARLFQPYFGSFFDNLKSGKVSFPGGTVEVDLERARESLDKAEQQSGSPRVTNDEIAEDDKEEEKAFDRLIQEFPAAAIISSYVPVELALRDAWDRYAVLYQKPTMSVFLTQKTVLRITRDLEASGAISRELSVALSRLRDIRNRAAHSQDFSVTADEAREFRSIANGAALQISALYRDAAKPLQESD